jgi:hypothetical protein
MKQTEEWWELRREERWLSQNAPQIIRSGKIKELAKFFIEGHSPLELDLVSIAAAYDGEIPDASDRELICRSELLHGVDLGFGDINKQPYFDGHTTPGVWGDLWVKWHIRAWYDAKKEKGHEVPIYFGQSHKWMLHDFPAPFRGTSAQDIDGDFF